MGELTERAVGILKILVESRGRVFEKPYEHQRRGFEAIEKLLAGDIDTVVVKAPCSAGKTEIPLSLFLAQFIEVSEQRIGRIIYVTPTQTLLYNMQERFATNLKYFVEYFRLHADQKIVERVNMLQPHVEHGLEPDPAYFIPRFTIASYDVVAYAWVAQRTIPFRPFVTRGALVSSMIVFDESHQLQDVCAYTQRVLPTLIAQMAKAGVPVVVMSATLPNEFTERLKEMLGKSSVEEVCASRLKDSRKDVGEIEVNVDLLENDVFELADAKDTAFSVVSDAVGEHRDVLLVFNSARVAYEVYEYLLEKLGYREDVKTLFVHGRLMAGVRRRREKLFEKLRKMRKENKNWSLIAVATQVAETGLDYSFDVVLSELAPPTAIVQRVMRSGREKGQKAEAIILPPVADDGRVFTHSIYTRDLIDHSRSWLQSEKLTIDKLCDIEFLTKVASEEYSILISRRERKENEGKDWIDLLVTEAERILNASLLVPPLMTSIQKKVLERFKLRLGEYTVLHVLDNSWFNENAGAIEEAAKVGKIEDLLNALSEYAENTALVVERSIRISLYLRRDKEGRRYVELPLGAVWDLGGRPVIFYVKILKRESRPRSDIKKTVVSYIRLRKESGGNYSGDVDKLCGKIVLTSIRDESGELESFGLISTDKVKIYV